MRFLSLFLLVSWLILSGCYSRKEGCLDTLAANYDVQADDACVTACCTYPSLYFELHHQVGDSSLKQGDTLMNVYGQSFRITDVRFYISAVTLLDEDGKSIIANDRIKTNTGLSVADDITIVRSADQEVEVAPFRAFGKFDSLHLSVGIAPDLALATWDGLPENHSLSFKNQLKDKNNALAVMTVKLAMVTPNGEAEKLISVSMPAGFPPASLHFPIAKTTDKGDAIRIPVVIDYSALLDSIDLSLSDTMIIQALAKNLGGFFFVK
jgi:hypothetical protein